MLTQLKTTRLRALEDRESVGAMDMIDTAMRPGEPLSTADDFPLLVGPNAGTDRLVIAEGDEILSHAACRDAVFNWVDGRRLRVANIGAVATREDARRQGHAAVIVRQLLVNTRQRGSQVAMLWTDQPAFYEKLGFRWAGCERRFVLSRERLEGKLEPDFEIAEMRPSDLPSMLAIREHDALALERSPEEAATLYGIPQSTTLVARRQGQTYAWVTVGKGLDFQGAVAEWGGAHRLIPTLLASHMDRQGLAELLVVGPTHDRGYTALAASYGTSEVVPLAMMKVLNETSLRRSFGTFAERHAPGCDLLESLFGSVEHGEGALPFYVWGLDSQ